MKVAKPIKVPILTRVVEVARTPVFHVAAMLGFPLASPRALLDEMAFWTAVRSELGESGVIDEGTAKARGEVLCAGRFFAPAGRPVPMSQVRIQLGAVDKRLAVFGDRFWRDRRASEPEPMTTMPIDWAHALGGPKFDRNPFGKGIEPCDHGGELRQPLPNIEPPTALVRAPGDRPEPASFLPMDVAFAQRRARGGTYDRRWFQEHFPGMPPDMAPTFFNLAAPDQWLEGMLRGDETLCVENMHPAEARLEGRLPGLGTRAFVTHKQPEGEHFVEIPMRCDTVWILPSLALGVVVFHGSRLIADDDGADIVHLVVACEPLGEARDPGHYRQALERRLDKDEKAIAELSDSDLMPPRESGVTPNIGELDVGRWTKSEGLRQQRARRGLERRLSQARAEQEAAGRDASWLAMPEPDPVPSGEDLDVLADYLRAQRERSRVEQAEREVTRARELERARQHYAELGQDYDQIVEQQRAAAAGPPAGTAEETLAALQQMAEHARAGGVPAEELERQLGDPAFRSRLEQRQRSALDGYRRSAHLRPRAGGRDAMASEMARVMVQAALDGKESLAGRDFTGLALSGMSLPGIDLQGALLESTDLSDCDLTGAKLAGAVLAHANLHGARLARADLHGANLGAADLSGASLEQADLEGAILSRATLAGACFVGARLGRADLLFTDLGGLDLTGAVLRECTLLTVAMRNTLLVGADLSEATLVECDLTGADLSRARMVKTTLVACQAAGACFRDAVLRQAIVVRATNLERADLRDADLELANLRGAVLRGARLDRALLRQADLSECDATGASFERAVLEGAMLIRARLIDASLRGANLADVLASKALLAGADFTGANLFQADLSRVVGDARTSFAEAELARLRTLPLAKTPPQGGSA